MKYTISEIEVDKEDGTLKWTEGWDHGQDNLMDTLYRRIIQTREDHIREGLIKLGWTPPPDKSKQP